MHSSRISISRRELVHKLRLFNTGLCRYSEQSGDYIIYGCDVENEFIFSGKFSLTFEGEKDKRRCCSKALVPSWKRKRNCALDNRRAHNRAHYPFFGCDDLLAKTLCIRVDVRPSPPLSALDAEIGEPLSDPDFSLAHDRRLQCAFIVQIAPFIDQPLPGFGAKTGIDDYIVGLFPYSSS